jgi:hypothetical protein
MRVVRNLVIEVLRDPRRIAGLGLPEWERLVREGRQGGLLGRIACLAEELGVADEVPAAPRAHLVAARNLVEAQHREVLREVAHVTDALAQLDVDIVLLKGAAYVLSGAAAAKGRLFTDIDILVARERLAEVEAALMLNGWATTHHDAYDQRYYRRWMHELPPLQHIHRHTVLDVHHAIVPLTGRLKPSSRKLQNAARPIGSLPRVLTLGPADMLLHSMAHLFGNGETQRCLRDLSDLDLLLRQFANEPEFWTQLFDRAAELDLAGPLFYGLRYSTGVLGTPVPHQARASCTSAAPGRLRLRLMDWLWHTALGASATSATVRSAELLLLARAHWLRMPPLMLMRHLLVKAMQQTEPSAVQA